MPNKSERNFLFDGKNRTALDLVILRVAEAISNERKSTNNKRLSRALFELVEHRNSLTVESSDQSDPLSTIH